MNFPQPSPSFHVKRNAKKNKIKAEAEAAREREARERAAKDFLRNKQSKFGGTSRDRRNSSGQRSSSPVMAYNRGQSLPRVPRDFSPRDPRDALTYDPGTRTFDGTNNLPQRARSPYRHERSRSPPRTNNVNRRRGRELSASTGPRVGADVYRPDHTADVRVQRYSNNRAPSETSLSHKALSEAKGKLFL